MCFNNLFDAYWKRYSTQLRCQTQRDIDLLDVALTLDTEKDSFEKYGMWQIKMQNNNNLDNENQKTPLP